MGLRFLTTEEASPPPTVNAWDVEVEQKRQGSVHSPVCLHPFDDHFDNLYCDDLVPLRIVHSPLYHHEKWKKERDAAEAAERAKLKPPKPKRMMPLAPRPNAVANEFLRQMAEDADQVAHRVLDDVNRNILPIALELEAQVHERMRIFREREVAVQERRRRQEDIDRRIAERLKRLEGAEHSSDEYVRELNLALLVAEACRRSATFHRTHHPHAVVQRVATEPGALHSMGAIMTDVAKRLHARAGATCEEVASALTAVAVVVPQRWLR